MRDYSKVSGQFWTGKTGKALRGDLQAQVVALYLMTSPHANMIGVFHCPVLYIAHETGSPIEGASKGLRSLIEASFCMYDEPSEFVFVRNMAKFQIGDQLDPKDKRVSGIQKMFDSLSDGPIKNAFYEHYKSAFCLKPLASPFEAPPKPEAGTGTGTEERTTLSGKPDPKTPTSDFSLDSTPQKPNFRAQAREVLDFLNEKTGKRFQPVDANLEMISARLREGFSVTQCRQVIAKKTREWHADEKMVAYLRPATLFNRQKFSQYTGELGVNHAGD